jgi:hypothetical protein
MRSVLSSGWEAPIRFHVAPSMSSSAPGCRYCREPRYGSSASKPVAKRTLSHKESKALRPRD